MLDLLWLHIQDIISYIHAYEQEAFVWNTVNLKYAPTHTYIYKHTHTDKYK